jgi:hypothetical protein
VKISPAVAAAPSAFGEKEDIAFRMIARAPSNFTDDPEGRGLEGVQNIGGVH